ncbi:MAG: hypothetical protein GX620_12060 [Chloroflexi bacterium]|nr:hypothetical protein [Chloroflexota bacterium]
MIDSSKLAEIRAKDPVINTFTWQSLKSAPKSVEEVYSAHALTHMSLGDTGKYVDTLARSITKNKFCSVGAIVGPYGYGKTSTAIHVWRELQQGHKILSVPPFEWLKLPDILEAVSAWVEYKFSQGPRQCIPALRAIYERYRDKSLEEVAADLGLGLAKAQEAYDSGSINLGVTPAAVLAFLLEVNALCVGEAGFSGLAVFVDELQETADNYPSIKSFQSDLFAFADKIPTEVGSLALIFTMPDTLEATINTTRPDIVHRLRQSSLYLRVEAIYGREFPSQLWEKFADVFGFREQIYEPVAQDTLDAIGQIASRRDLGSGPRTVINALVQAVKHYEVTARSYSPLDLVDGFLDNKIVFEEQGKFSNAVRQALENRLVGSKPEYRRTIKLIAAFPLGCTMATIKAAGLALAFDQLVESPIYGDIIYHRSEGYTLRSLLEVEVEVEPTYVRLVRDDFVRSYMPDFTHARLAMRAFRSHLLEPIFEAGRRNQLDKWQWQKSDELPGQDAIAIELSGSFTYDYPCREVGVTLLVSPRPVSPSWGRTPKEFDFTFALIFDADDQTTGRVLLPPGDDLSAQVAFQLNLMAKPAATLSIPRLPEIYPPERMTPLFMLSLLQYLDDIDDRIPAPEKTGELRVVKERLAQYATRGLLGGELVVDDRFGTQDVGYALVRSIFLKMCKVLYPHYQTLIRSSQWEKHLEAYVKALRDPLVDPGIARGREPLTTTKDYITRLFGQTSMQTARSLINESLIGLTQLEWGSGRDEQAKMWFLMHPLEQHILQLLRDSNYAEQRPEGTIRLLPALELFEAGRALGYTREEVGAVIQLLSGRELVTYNSTTNSVEQLIRTVDDLRLALLDALANIQAEIETLTQVAEFDPERYQTRIEDVKKGAQELESSEYAAERAEELNATLRSIESGLRKYIAVSAGRLLADLRSSGSQIQPLLSAGVPEELLSPIVGGQAPWSGALEESRQRLRKRYDETVARYKKVAQDISAKLATLGQVELHAGYLVELVGTHAECQTMLAQLAEQRVAVSANLRSLRAWKQLLTRANQVHQDAVTAKASFGETEFLEAAEAIWSEIIDRFREGPVDALSDYEPFSDSVAELERHIGEWQRRRRDTFMAEKRTLEDALDRLGDEQPRLKTNFDSYAAPEDNRRDLREEAVEHFQRLLQRCEQRCQQLQSEVIYAERLQQITGSLTASAVSSALVEVDQLRTGITPKSLSSESDLDVLTEKIAGMQSSLREMVEQARGFITKRLPDRESEKELLRAVQASAEGLMSGVELREVILKLVAEDPDFQLEQVMRDLQSLFLNNQVIIRIQPRR